MTDSSVMETQTFADNSPLPERSRPPSSAASALGLSHGRQEPTDYAPGRLLGGRYRIVGLLGRGGMGQVYRADDLTLGQAVALKFLPESVAEDSSWLKRFREEVRVARQVSHPNVCRVHDIGEAEGRVFLSMELVDGGDLASLLKRVGRLPRERGLEIARQLCAGLAAAHDKGVLHRDLKPANVMIDSEGKVRLTDFGLAGLEGGFEGKEIRSGTPAYMAPEALAGEEVTQRSDIYALGLLLSELFTGSRTHGASVAEGSPQQPGSSRPSSGLEHGSDLDPEIQRVIEHCLEAEPSRRPASALAVAMALPGGDPLAAMMAAGETPSPELVAQAGDVGALSRPKAWSLLLFIILGFAAIGCVENGRSLLSQATPPSPAVQLDHAHATLAQLGYSDPAVDTAYGYTVDDEALSQVNDGELTEEGMDRLRKGDPPVIRFWLRESPAMLVPTGLLGMVNAEDPPQNLAGMIYATFDSRHLLHSLEVVPDRDSHSELLTGEESWNALLGLAGLDPQALEETKPLWTPPHFVTETRAWVEKDPKDPDRILRVEAGAVGGRVSHLRRSRDWKDVKSHSRGNTTATSNSARLASTLIFLLVLGAGGLLARHNLRLGRGDTKGARTLAGTVLFLGFLAWAFSAHHVSSPAEELDLLVTGLGVHLFRAAVTWLLYVALEPLVRRHWPHRLISWNRLLARRVMDPLVGRDLLVGVAFGILLGIYISAATWLQQTIEGEASLSATGISSLVGSGLVLGRVASICSNAIFGGIFVTIMIFLARLVLRRTWAAVTLAGLFMLLETAASTDNLWVSLPAAAVLFAVILFTLLRYGLLPLAATVLTLNLVENFPITLPPPERFLHVSAIPAAFLLILTIGAFTVSLGRKSWFGSTTQ